MIYIDWSMVLFVGATMAQEIWLYYGLPRMYYSNVSNSIKNNNKIDAA